MPYRIVKKVITVSKHGDTYVPTYGYYPEFGEPHGKLINQISWKPLWDSIEVPLYLANMSEFYLTEAEALEQIQQHDRIIKVIESPQEIIEVNI